MARTTLNFWLDTLLLFLFTAMVFVAAVLRFVFPPGPQAGGWRLWSLDYVTWSNLHFGLTATMLGAVVLHVMLHWSWVCGVVAGFRGTRGKARNDGGVRTLYGVGLLLLILHAIGIALAAATLTIEEPPRSAPLKVSFTAPHAIGLDR